MVLKELLRSFSLRSSLLGVFFVFSTFITPKPFHIVIRTPYYFHNAPLCIKPLVPLSTATSICSFPISSCSHCNRVHHHPLPVGQLLLRANLFSCMFLRCPSVRAMGHRWNWVAHSPLLPALCWHSDTQRLSKRWLHTLDCWSVDVSTTSWCLV